MAADPASAEFNFMKAIVVKSHHATDETQLELRLNDIVYVLEQDDSGWWGGHKEGEDCTGWFPGSCVRETEDQVPEPEPFSEPTPQAQEQSPVLHSSPWGMEPQLAVVPEEAAAASARAKEMASTPPKGCDAGLEMESLPEALQHGNRLVASPNRRVSSEGPSAALASLKAEYTTAAAIAEDRSLEIQRLQADLAEAAAARNSEAAAARLQSDELRRQFQNCETEKLEMQRKAQELGSNLDLRAMQLEQIQQQLTRAQQENRERASECAQMQRSLQDKDTELAELRKQLSDSANKAVGSGGPVAFASSRDLPPAAELDTRRRLFPSTVEAAGGVANASFDGPLANASYIDESSVATSSVDIVSRPCGGSVRQHAQQPRGVSAGAANRATPAAPAPRPFGSSAQRANSLMRPAYRPMPGSSPGAQSPGLAKCHSTGDLPPTPVRIGGSEEAPVLGSVKEKKAFFEQVAAQRSSTPSRGAATTDSVLNDTPSNRSGFPPIASAREQRWPISARTASSPCLRQDLSVDQGQAVVPRQFPRLDLLQLEEAPVEQVNFNMSPMKRQA